jgi:uncharacterized protein DUF6516
VNHVGVYFDHVLLTALGSPKVKRVEQVRREHDATGRIGFMLYRLTLINYDLLELTERVEVQAGEIVVTKYRQHWQNQEGAMLKRWDNFPHYPQIASFPHHLHDGAEDNVVAHPPVNALQVLR